MAEPTLSVILPMFNEEVVLRAAVREVSAQLERTGLSFEVVCVNDGSSDGTGQGLDQLAAVDPCVIPVHFTRNFGKEAAMAAGLDHARGQAVLLLDADLQHPPELIPRMVDAWRAGADVVSGVKASRGKEGIVYKMMAGLFNTLMGSSLSGNARSGFHGASDFKLLDRQVVDALCQCPERHRFFRGLVAWVGFRTVEIPFEVQERAAGESSWTLRGLVRYSLSNLLAFTALPLRLIAAAGFSMLTFTGMLGLWQLFRYFRGDSLAGFPTVILLQLIFGSILLTSLGVISLYLAEMYDELKRRPLYLYRAADPKRDRVVPQPVTTAPFGTTPEDVSVPSLDATILSANISEATPLGAPLDEIAAPGGPKTQSSPHHAPITDEKEDTIPGVAPPSSRSPRGTDGRD